MSAPLVSVLVPVYNVGRYVGSCLESLLAQDLAGVEVIVVNDGSTDDSRDVISRVCANDDRVRVIDKENSGYGASLNRALDEARGQFIGILESDDELVDGALALLLSEALRLGADVVKGDFLYWWSEDEARTVRAHEISSDMCGALVDTTEDLRIYSRKSTIWSAVYRTAFLREHGIRFLETPGAAFQDTSFNFKVFASCHKAAFVDAPVIRYRQDNEGSSVHSKDKADAVGVEFDEIDRWLVENAEPQCLDRLLQVSLVQRFNAYLWNLDRLDEPARLAFLCDIGSQYEDYEREGRLRVDDWDGWRLANLRALQRDPSRYLRLRGTLRSGTKLGKARFALALGGPFVLLSAVREQSGRR